jgi:hypothetical protein
MMSLSLLEKQLKIGPGDFGRSLQPESEGMDVGSTKRVLRRRYVKRE